MPSQIQFVPAYSCVGSSCVQNASLALLNEVVEAHTFYHLIKLHFKSMLGLIMSGISMFREVITPI